MKTGKPGISDNVEKTYEKTARLTGAAKTHTKEANIRMAAPFIAAIQVKKCFDKINSLVIINFISLVSLHLLLLQVATSKKLRKQYHFTCLVFERDILWSSVTTQTTVPLRTNDVDVRCNQCRI